MHFLPAVALSAAVNQWEREIEYLDESRGPWSTTGSGGQQLPVYRGVARITTHIPEEAIPSREVAGTSNTPLRISPTCKTHASSTP